MLAAGAAPVNDADRLPSHFANRLIRDIARPPHRMRPRST
jgi:hypothetical protein